MALANGGILDAWSPRAFLGGGPSSSQRLDHLPPDEPFIGFEGESLESLGIRFSTSFAFGGMRSSSQEALSVHMVGGGDSWCHSSSSLLNFARGNSTGQCSSYLSSDREEDFDAMAQSYQLKPTAAESWLIEDQSCSEIVSAYSSSGSPEKHKRQQSSAENLGIRKRPCMDGNMPSPKKTCGASRTLKDKQSPCKDPQSIAAKNRRERISERLRILQDIVPNGTKVDLVTMLEKAINYVKFLQVQVKVLATDEFWPAQGGKDLILPK
ncbi:hypothetical protein Cni_G21267 [Canna indica]|uniref:BHLH domain-containing protein n=1 Tax=Canna indica TaxID=4628 RepID=A0AAQ3KQJ3_9LILI|nr:hypothetical protein Cni_G21267 [Canna indica]